MTDQQTSRTTITEAMDFWFAQGPLIHGRDQGGIDIGPLIGEARTEASAANLVRSHNAMVRAALAAEPRSDAVTAPEEPDEPSTCPDCGLTAQRIGEIHINAQRAKGRSEPIHVGPQSAERDAILAGTHEPAVDDFGNQYLARTASASVPALDRAELIALRVAIENEIAAAGDEPKDPFEQGAVAAYQFALSLLPDAAYAAETPEQGRGDE